MDPRLVRALERWSLADPRPLAGDAGARQYVRVLHPHLGTALVVLNPTDEPGRNDPTHFEFQALHAYLDPLMPVPAILHADDEDRVLLIEDVGDMTLEHRLSTHPEEEQKWAKEAGRLLATWVGPLTQAAPGHSFFMSRAFDQPKFDFEWAYCKTNFFQDFLGKEAPRWLDRLMDEVHASLATRAHFLVHRDFHVRNLMVQGDRLITLDFQDARRGAATYDLASLRFDGYWDWSPEAGHRLVEAVRSELGWPEGALNEELRLSGLQRNLKALGTFGHQLVHKKKAHFASAIPRTLRHLRNHFQHLNHLEGALATEHWIRIAKEKLLGMREG